MRPLVLVTALSLVLLAPAASEGQEPSTGGAASARQFSPGFLCRPVETELDGLMGVPEAQRVGQPQTATTIDVLFLTSAAFGSAHRIGITVREVNQGFADSNTGITLRNVGTRQAPSTSYISHLLGEIERADITTETRFRWMNDLLQRLRRDSSVERMRSDANADLVVALADQGGRWGQGTTSQVGPAGFDRQKGFIVLSDSLGLVTRKHLLMHEIGHTLGLAHQPGERDWRAPYLPHGQGYVPADRSHGTVMAQGARPPWVPVFSFDGHYHYNGQQRRMGDRNHRAADAASVGAQFVAAYEGASAPTPDPEPDPDPDPVPVPDPTPEGEYTNCVPLTSPLVFDGDYRVSMCYATLEGGGDAKAGIWASGQSGLLWFFDRGNAEVLVKVLDGCAHNGYRWVFVAPVTTLAFNLRITDREGRAWTHRNRQGMTASTKSDIRAFPCR